MRRVIAPFMATAAVSAGLLGTASPAHAVTTEFCTQPFARAGVACFYSDGDKITVQDLWADGMRSVAMWTTSYGRSGECHDANGANNPPTVCDYDFRENSQVVIEVVRREGANGANHDITRPIIGWTSGR
ncbi:hypothetical protein [Streptomyces sp. AC550_RSS872]|uniref:hypothetical protein n=1 Tax=Streptomyces sp. AC550_RSS872 TaxID=2823689 RepID=UPI001C269166|nr:hypothetical protein [Streptomyces sp. AC550_RSS872]